MFAEETEFVLSVLAAVGALEPEVAPDPEDAVDEGDTASSLR